MAEIVALIEKLPYSSKLKFFPCVSLKKGIKDPYNVFPEGSTLNLDLVLTIEGRSEHLMPLVQELYAFSGIEPIIGKKKLVVQRKERRIRQDIQEYLKETPYILQALNLEDPSISEEYIKTDLVDSLGKEIVAKIVIPIPLFDIYYFRTQFIRILSLHNRE